MYYNNKKIVEVNFIVEYEDYEKYENEIKELLKQIVDLKGLKNIEIKKEGN